MAKTRYFAFETVDGEEFVFELTDPGKIIKRREPYNPLVVSPRSQYHQLLPDGT